MSYTRVNWEDLPSTNTPVNATNLNKMDAKIKVLDTEQTMLQTQIANLPKKAKQPWARSMSFEMQPGQHALVMIDDSDCVMIWMTSGGMHFARILGNGVNVVLSGNVITITKTNNENFAGNAIIS